MRPEVVSLGEPLLEFNAEEVGSLSQVTRFIRGFGGDTSNFIVAVSRLGRKGGYICKLGGDEFGKCFLEMWRREGVDTSHVIIEEGGFTGIYFISLKNGGEHDFTYYRADSAASHLSPRDLNPDYFKGIKVFHTSGISQAISESCREAVFKAIEYARDAGALISYDPNIRLKLWPKNLARAIVEYTFKLSDIVLPSKEDLNILYGESPIEETVEKILDMGPRIVAVKLGPEGCIVASKGEFIRVKGIKVKPVDTTGAGDAFDGAFIVGLLEGWSHRRVAEFANATGALTTLGKGAVEPIPRRERVISFLRESKLW